MSRKIQILKLIASLLIGLSISFFYWVGSFVAEQSTLVLRGLKLHPIYLIYYGPLGIVIGIIVFVVIRKSERTFLSVGILLFCVSIAIWWLVGLPSISHFILPSTTTK